MPGIFRLAAVQAMTKSSVRCVYVEPLYADKLLILAA